MTTDDVYLSFLPLAHILDRVIEEYFFHKGASVGYYQGVKWLTGHFFQLDFNFHKPYFVSFISFDCNCCWYFLLCIRTLML